jgi:8-oxo-dGTP pyrophosphatase MutT (NUDIX family)
MYKIFINDIPIYLSDKKAKNKKKKPCIKYKNDEEIYQILQQIEDDEPIKRVTIYGKNLAKVTARFFSKFKTIEAAGGLVTNKIGDILMIYKRGKWDLPKGKIEPEESREKAALREISEETNLHNLEILDPLPTTFHIFSNKPKQRVLKIVHWFKVRSEDKKQPVPCSKEKIEKAEWVSTEKMDRKLKKTYPSILDVIEAGAN